MKDFERPKRNLPEKFCEYCGHKFYVFRPNQKCCCFKCAQLLAWGISKK